MTLAELNPFAEAMRSLAARGVLPTNLNTAELRQMGDGFHRQNFTSAQTLLSDLLDQYKADVEKIVNPTTETTDNGPRTTGLNVAEARLRAKELLQRLGYQPNEGEAGTLKDLSSDRRINLVIETNRDVARGAGWFIQGNDPDALDAFPAQELVRVVQPRTKARDWKSRWLIAATAAGDSDAIRVLETTGRMMARKDSPVWQQLGSSANFDDGLDNPFPPFAFNSGMDVRDIAYSEALRFGLIQPGEAVRPSLPADLSKLFSLS